MFISPPKSIVLKTLLGRLIAFLAPLERACALTNLCPGLIDCLRLIRYDGQVSCDGTLKEKRKMVLKFTIKIRFYVNRGDIHSRVCVDKRTYRILETDNDAFNEGILSITRWMYDFRDYYDEDRTRLSRSFLGFFSATSLNPGPDLWRLSIQRFVRLIMRTLAGGWVTVWIYFFHKSCLRFKGQFSGHFKATRFFFAKGFSWDSTLRYGMSRILFSVLFALDDLSAVRFDAF